MKFVPFEAFYSGQFVVILWLFCLTYLTYIIQLCNIVLLDCVSVALPTVNVKAFIQQNSSTTAVVSYFKHESYQQDYRFRDRTKLCISILSECHRHHSSAEIITFIVVSIIKNYRRMGGNGRT